MSERERVNLPQERRSYWMCNSQGCRSSREELNQAKQSISLQESVNVWTANSQRRKNSKHNSDNESKWSRDDFPQKSPNSQSLGDEKPHLSGRKSDEPRQHVEPRKVQPRRKMRNQDVESRRNKGKKPWSPTPLPRSMKLVKIFEKFSNFYNQRESTPNPSKHKIRLL